MKLLISNFSSNLTLFEQYKDLQPFITRANIALSNLHYHCNKTEEIKLPVQIMFRRINIILLGKRNEKFPENDYQSFKLINSLRVRMDEATSEEFKQSVVKLMHYLIDFNKYISQRIDELAPWHTRALKK